MLLLEDLLGFVDPAIDPETEKDTLMLAYSLLGIIKERQRAKHEVHIEGLELLEKAQKLSDEMGPMYERRKLLVIPEI